MNLQNRGIAMMNRLAAQAAAISGIYTRRASAGGGSVTLTSFVAGNSDWTSQPAAGEVRTRLDFQTRTLLGPSADLVITGTDGDGEPFTPGVGDMWQEDIAGRTYLWKVTDESGHRAVTYCDTQRERVRIRMKLVSVS